MKREEEQKTKLEKIKVDLGDEAYSEEKKAMEESNAAEEEPVFEAPILPSKILKLYPLKDKFYLSMVRVPFLSVLTTGKLCLLFIAQSSLIIYTNQPP